MIKGTIIKDVVSMISGDSALQTIFAPFNVPAFIYKARTRKTIQIPVIFWSLISSNLEENEEMNRVHLTFLVPTVDMSMQIEDRLLRLFHSDLPIMFPTTGRVWSQFDQRVDIESPAEDIVGCGLDFKITTARRERL